MGHKATRCRTSINRTKIEYMHALLQKEKADDDIIWEPVAKPFLKEHASAAELREVHDINVGFNRRDPKIFVHYGVFFLDKHG